MSSNVNKTFYFQKKKIKKFFVTKKAQKTVFIRVFLYQFTFTETQLCSNVT